MGVAIALLMAPMGYWVIPFALLWALGSTTGWGTPIGAALNNETMGRAGEWRQVGVLKPNTFLALLARGCIWGLPVLLLSPWFVTWPAFVAISISFTAAPYLARLGKEEWFKYSWLAKRWHLQEWIRGLLTGLLTYLIAGVL